MTEVGGIAGERLRSFIERVERLNEDVRALNADKSEIFKEAKATGFDPKTMKRCIQLRAMDASDRDEQEYLTDLYMRAIETGTSIATRVGARETAAEHTEIHEGPVNRDQSTDGKSCPEPLAAERSSHAGTGSGVLPRHGAVIERGGDADDAAPEAGSGTSPQEQDSGVSLRSAAAAGAQADGLARSVEGSSPPPADHFDPERDMPAFLRRTAA